MADDDTLTLLLTELDGIANAPMTAPQRQSRAAPLLPAAGVSVAEVIEALSREDLPWNRRKAAEYGLSVHGWLAAVSAVSATTTDSLLELLDRLHKIESAAQMIKAGYRPVTEHGKLIWQRG